MQTRPYLQPLTGHIHTTFLPDARRTSLGTLIFFPLSLLDKHSPHLPPLGLLFWKCVHVVSSTPSPAVVDFTSSAEACRPLVHDAL